MFRGQYHRPDTKTTSPSVWPAFSTTEHPLVSSQGHSIYSPHASSSANENRHPSASKNLEKSSRKSTKPPTKKSSSSNIRKAGLSDAFSTNAFSPTNHAGQIRQSPTTTSPSSLMSSQSPLNLPQASQSNLSPGNSVTSSLRSTGSYLPELHDLGFEDRSSLNDLWITVKTLEKAVVTLQKRLLVVESPSSGYSRPKVLSGSKPYLKAVKNYVKTCRGGLGDKPHANEDFISCVVQDIATTKGVLADTIDMDELTATLSVNEASIKEAVRKDRSKLLLNIKNGLSNALNVLNVGMGTATEVFEDSPLIILKALMKDSALENFKKAHCTLSMGMTSSRGKRTKPRCLLLIISLVSI